MENSNTYIGIIEPSTIIFEGLSNILLKEDVRYKIVKFESLKELYTYKDKYKLKIIIINPGVITTNKTTFNSLKTGLSGVSWIGLIYSFYDSKTLSLLNSTIQITDSKKHIISVVNKYKTYDFSSSTDDNLETLSERETDVLIELVNGLSNKEIADKLHISVHTVTSHRKNIVQKTSIKSVAGLTIYAITNNIISIDNIS